MIGLKFFYSTEFDTDAQLYSTCIHCTADLGRNEAFEVFPVGNRLAFDPALGRLWVVCSACERWNLSPLEERWEAVEAAERRFRSSRLRTSTDNIGMARLKENVDLIRIGKPLRPEMAVWRYGDQFGRRLRKQVLLSGVAVTASAAAVAALFSLKLGMLLGSVQVFMGPAFHRVLNGSQNEVIARVRGAEGEILTVTRALARMSVVERSDGSEMMWLRLRHIDGETMLHGAPAYRAAAQILPAVNRMGGTKKMVRAAVEMLEEAGDTINFFRRLQSTHGAREYQTVHRVAYPFGKSEHVNVLSGPGLLHSLPDVHRLAFEMALHEQSERRAMAGELAELERTWREAEEIAKISDGMLLSPTIEARLNSARSTRDRQ